jgi:two-component system NarL family response regulator
MDPAKFGLHPLKPRLRAIPRPDPFAPPGAPEGQSGGPRETAASRSADAIRVFLIDPHALLRHGLRVLLGSQGDLEIVGEAGSAGSAVDEVAASKPDVVLMDIAAPAADGIGAIRAIKTRSRAPSATSSKTFRRLICRTPSGPCSPAPP